MASNRSLTRSSESISSRWASPSSRCRCSRVNRLRRAASSCPSRSSIWDCSTWSWSSAARISVRRRSSSAIRWSLLSTSRSSKLAAATASWAPRSRSSTRSWRSSSVTSVSSSTSRDSREASSPSMSAMASSLEKPMMLRVSLRPWAPRRPLRVWPARVTRRPAPASSAALSTHRALRAGSSTCAWTQPENGESLKSSLPAIRSGSAGPRSGRSSSTPSKVSRPRSCRPSMAAEKSSSRSSGTSITRAEPPRTVSIAVRQRASSGATSTSSATNGSWSTVSPLACATSARSSCIRAGIRPARLSSEVRSRRSSLWRWLSG